MARHRLRTAMQAWLDAACDFAQGGGLAVVAAAAACLGARSRVAAAWAQWRAWQAAAPSASRRGQQRVSHELGISADLETSPGQPLGSELALYYLPSELACLWLRLKHAWPRWARECRLWRCRHAAAVAVAQRRSTRRLAAALWGWALRTEARSLTLATAQLCQSAKLRRVMRTMRALAAGRRRARAQGGAPGSIATSAAHRLRRVRAALSRWEAVHHRQRARAWRRWQAERHAVACAQRGALRRWAEWRQLRLHGAVLAELAPSWRGERQRRALRAAIAAWRRQPLVAIGRAALLAWILRSLRAAAPRAPPGRSAPRPPPRRIGARTGRRAR